MGLTHLKQFQRYFVVFYLLGQNLIVMHPNYQKKNSLKYQFIVYFPTAFFLTLFFILTPVIVIQQQTFQLFNSNSDAFMNYVFILMGNLLNAIIFVQIITATDGLYNLIDKLNLLLKYLHERLKLNVSLRDFANAYVKKVFLLFSIIFLTIVVKSFISSRRSTQLHQWCQLTFIAYKNLVIVHLMFYIDLMHFLYKMYNNYMDVMCYDILTNVMHSNGNHYLSVLKHCKYVHYKMWKIVNMINNYFGWILLLIIVVNFIDICYATYWIFIYKDALQKRTPHVILRKFDS